MAAVVIPYRILGKGAPMPLLTIHVTIDGQDVPFPGLVDSGSDRSAVPEILAATLGLQWDPNDPKQGLSSGGAYGYFRAANSIFVRTEVGIFRMDRPNVNAKLDKFGILILGRTDFFASFRIVFDHKGLTMSFERYADEIAVRKN
jgi:hypothetical protein